MNYVVCSSPRSGSTLLSQTLLAMGVGNPGEFFNPSLVDEPELGGPDNFMKPTPQAYVERLKRDQTVNGVFGIKVHYADLIRYTDIGDNLAYLFPGAKYISITRRNVLRQALSASRAAQTMAWTSRLKEHAPSRFHFFAVLKHVIRTLREVEGWERYYAAHGIKPLRVVYEDLDEEYERTMLGVLTFLGVEGRIPPRPIRKQADAVTEEWVDRFMSAFRGRGLLPDAVRLLTRRW